MLKVVYKYLRPISKLDKRILLYETDRSFRLGQRINIKAQEILWNMKYLVILNGQMIMKESII